MNLKTKILPHQKDAFDKMKELSVGALFMEMGTGKTRTTLELIKFRMDSRKIKKVVWFTPVSTKRNLQREIEKHSDVKISVFNDKTSEDSIVEAVIHIVGVESTVSNRVKLAVKKTIDKDTMLVVDESTYIKNHKAKRSKFIGEISSLCRYKLILNGTPTTNSVSDLYFQFNFLSPKILGYRSFASFANIHLQYDDKIPGRVIGSKDIDYIAQRISNFTFSIKKEDCIKITNKKYVTLEIEMSEEQVKMYESTKQKLIYESFSECREIDVLLLFNKLQQISSGFLINDNTTDIIGTTKLKTISKILEDLKEKVVIFYKYRAEEHFIKQTNKKTMIINGSIKAEKRDRIIKKFEKDKYEVLAINLSCGSYGLNLQFINKVIYFSNKFNFSERLQSEDRFHRIGQTEDVIYYDIISSNIERRINESLLSKENLLNYLSKKLKNKNNEYKEYI